MSLWAYVKACLFRFCATTTLNCSSTGPCNFTRIRQGRMLFLLHSFLHLTHHRSPQHIPKTPPPVFPNVSIPRPSGTEQNHDIGTGAYESQPYHPPTLSPPQPTHQPTHQWSMESLRGARDRDASSRSFRLASHGSLPSAHEDGTEAVVVDVAPPLPQPPRRHSKGTVNADFPAIFTRTPPVTPVLRPEHRYCYRCERVKPHRAHHCRACATCVLRYDHHCPCEYSFLSFL
jgi:palmitoyltransferase